MYTNGNEKLWRRVIKRSWMCANNWMKTWKVFTTSFMIDLLLQWLYVIDTWKKFEQEITNKIWKLRVWKRVQKRKLCLHFPQLNLNRIRWILEKFLMKTWEVFDEVFTSFVDDTMRNFGYEIKDKESLTYIQTF